MTMTTTNSTVDSNGKSCTPVARPVPEAVPGVGRRAGERILARVTSRLRRRSGSGDPGRAPRSAGPRQRTDEDVLRACLQALSWNAVVPEGAVRLDVQQGHVTLTGTVRLPHERAAAEMAIQDIGGVVSVSNLVGLAPVPAPVGIADRIHAAVSRSPRHAGNRVEVHVDGACVLLAGQVGSRTQRDAAVAAAWAEPGVAHVIDEIVVTAQRLAAA